MEYISEKDIKSIHKRKLKKKVLIPIIALIVIAVIALLVIVHINYKNNVKKYEKLKLYQYLSGVKFEYSGTITFTRKSGIVNLKSSDYQLDLDSTPIYVKNSNKMILPKTMGVYDPSVKNKAFKISDMTMIENYPDSENQSILLYEYENVPLNNSFLFDGNNTYVFLDDVKLFIGDEVVNLSALSYVITGYRSDLEYYDYKNDKYIIIEDLDKDVLVQYDKYVINLSTDLIKYVDGSFKLLNKNVDLLPVYKSDIKSK